MSLRTIRLELARCPEFPFGSRDRGYEFRAPLTDAGDLDPAEWKRTRRRCTVRRFWPGEEEERGHLLHTRRQDWVFHYDGIAADEDEPIFALDRHRLVEGEYVSVTEHDGVLRPFRVASVR
jgi:hypothetical protein